MGACAMPVAFEVGDIFATPAEAVAPGCNCAGAMGKGIAATFRERWPEMYTEYRRRCRLGTFQLGDVFVWEAKPTTVFNLGTQLSWKTKADLNALQTALQRMISDAEERAISQILIPRIGAGLGKLEWTVVRPMLEGIGVGTSVKLRVCETFAAGRPMSGD